jgi:sec-independent protein translocase protein TatA
MITAIITLFIGTTELLLIGGIALLLFGGKKLPEMMRGLGKGVAEFKNGLKDETPATEETTDIPNNANDETAQSEEEKSKPSE